MGSIMHDLWTCPNTENDPGPRAAHSCDMIDGKLFIFGGWNGKKALNDLHLLDVEAGVWTEVIPNKNAPAARNNHTTAVVDCRLFAHGGHDGSKWLADMHILDTSPVCAVTPFSSSAVVSGDGSSPSLAPAQADLEQLTWVKAVTSGVPPSARACHTLTRLNKKLYMFGGYDGTKCFNEIDVLDLDTMTWIQPGVGGPLPQARNAHTMTVIGTRLYLFGGHSGNKHLTDLHIFDTSSLTWTQPALLGAPPPGLRGHTANLIGSKVFLFGGYDGKGRSNDLYILDSTNEEHRWCHPAECEHAPAGRQRHSACLVGSKKLYVFGGFDGNKWLNDLHILDVGKLEENALNEVAVQSLIRNMRALLNSPDFSDITLTVEGQSIYAHKAILVAQCEHFRAMFSGPMKESRDHQIVIPDWGYSPFMAMLEFLYTGRMPGELSVRQLTEVLGLADHYALDGLKHMCENILIHSVDVDNVCHLLTQADRYQAAELKSYTMTYILKNFDRVARSSTFEQLSSVPALLLEVTRAAAVSRSHS